jgi:hypothetical protein
MNAYDQHRATQGSQKRGFDFGPSIQDVDADLADVSEATLERYARSGHSPNSGQTLGSAAD